MVNKSDGPQVLIVEDDNDLREALASALEDDGLTVDTAGNGREALDLLDRHPNPCLILLDLMMPVMNGWEFLAERGAKDGLMHIPVVVVSAFGKNLPTDVDQVLRKPVDLDHLITLVNGYCHRQH